ncbi:MAG TPA: hypothetical protein VM755_07715 [Stellaceae bacterium]|nr:hypothetical protein [Stellaceae bacterium]
MRRRVGIAVSAALALALLAAPAAAFQNEPAGYGGLKWGTPLSAVHAQFVPANEGGYRRRGERAAIYGVPAEAPPVYTFAANFANVVGVVPLSNGLRMLAALRSRFGRPTSVRGDEATWNGATADVALTCEAGGCVVFIGQSLRLPAIPGSALPTYNTVAYCSHMGDSYFLEKSCRELEASSRAALERMQIPGRVLAYCKGLEESDPRPSYFLLKSCVALELQSKRALDR